VHGHWEDVGSLSCRCSECGCKNDRETMFCPNCGAKMDFLYDLRSGHENGGRTMIRIMKELWARNSKELKRIIGEMEEDDIDDLEYKDLVKLTFQVIFNNKDARYFYYDVNIDKIHEIDDGDYQGTLLYIIPFQTYQPAENEYLMTFVNYGSCSGCDTLQAIQYDGGTIEEKHKDIYKLCLDLACGTVRPYNDGWRNTDGLFDQAEEENGQS